MIVVDASAVLEAVLHDGGARERLSDGWLCAPYLVDAEFLSGLRSNVNHGDLDPGLVPVALADFASIQILRYAHDWLLERAWALRDNLTSCDALYVALAEALDEVLVTCDARLAKAPGIRARVEVVPVGA